MSINQINEALNDAFETYFPKMNPLVRLPYGATTLALSWAIKARTRLFGGKVMTNERIVEYPQLLRWLPDTGTILDIGCVSSRLPLQLASMGYTVHGLDTRDYTFTHPNFRFFRSDLFTWSPPLLYDTICLISVIEHFGFGGYGDMVAPEADQEAIARIKSWLVPGGSLIVSFPYGKSAVLRKYRIYDAERLNKTFAGFERLREAYFQRVDNVWLPSNAETLADVDSPHFPVNGVAILQLRNS